MAKSISIDKGERVSCELLVSFIRGSYNDLSDEGKMVFGFMFAREMGKDMIKYSNLAKKRPDVTPPTH